jgi:hypothetical protein
MEAAYCNLREKYRNLVQYVIKIEIGDASVKAHYNLTYRKKNIKKSIETDLHRYSLDLLGLSKEMSLSDTYWQDYNFSEYVLDHFRDTDVVELSEFAGATDLYFQEMPSEGGDESEKSPRNLDKENEQMPDFLKSFINNEAFAKMFQDMAKLGKDKKSDDADPNAQNSAPIEFPEEIVKLAQELSTEIQIPDFLNMDGSEAGDSASPQKLFEKLTTQEGQNVFRNLIQKTSDKIKNKIDAGEIDEEKIRSSAQDCLKTFLEKNNDLQDLLTKNFPGQAFEMLNQTLGKSDRVPCGQSNDGHKASDARVRLQRKLQNKKKC